MQTWPPSRWQKKRLDRVGTVVPRSRIQSRLRISSRGGGCIGKSTFQKPFKAKKGFTPPIAQAITT
jgi:hypothetical protein